MITLDHYIALSIIVFCIGLIGVLRRKNLLMLFFSVEIMLNAVNIGLIATSSYFGDITGQIAALFIIAIAAAEVAVGLGLLVYLNKTHKSIDLDILNTMKG